MGAAPNLLHKQLSRGLTTQIDLDEMEGSMKPTETSLQVAAKTHLRLLKSEHVKQDLSDRYYVSLAYSYGLEVDAIAVECGLTVSRVQQLLAGV